jgi:hypothetical protein
MSRFLDFLVRWGELTFENSRETYIKRFNLEGLQIPCTTQTDQRKSNQTTD